MVRLLEHVQAGLGQGEFVAGLLLGKAGIFNLPERDRLAARLPDGLGILLGPAGLALGDEDVVLDRLQLDDVGPFAVLALGELGRLQIVLGPLRHQRRVRHGDLLLLALFLPHRGVEFHEDFALLDEFALGHDLEDRRSRTIRRGHFAADNLALALSTVPRSTMSRVGPSRGAAFLAGASACAHQAVPHDATAAMATTSPRLDLATFAPERRTGTDVTGAMRRMRGDLLDYSGMGRCLYSTTHAGGDKAPQRGRRILLESGARRRSSRRQGRLGVGRNACPLFLALPLSW